MAISVVLWVLASYGPGDNINKAREHVIEQTQNLRLNNQALEDRIASYKLEHSYAGIIGKSIEPVIKPLGYDWKIGIALITSFAAREVFVGTMATLYSVGDDDSSDGLRLREKMQMARKADGSKVYTLASGLSLMIFYLLAMQCMSTLVIVKRETRGWKIPLIQLGYMTGLAYVMSLIVYQIFK